MKPLYTTSFTVPVLHTEMDFFDTSYTTFPVRSLNPSDRDDSQLNYLVFENSQMVLDPTQTTKHRNSFIFARSILSYILQKDDGLYTYSISKVVSKVCN